MGDTDWTQCPACKWTGRTKQLEAGDGEWACPACGATVVVE